MNFPFLDARFDSALSNLIVALAVITTVGLGLPVLALAMRRLSSRGRLVVSFILAMAATGAVALAVTASVSVDEGSSVALDVMRGAALLLWIHLAIQMVDVLIVESLLGSRLKIEVPRLVRDLMGFVALGVTVAIVVSSIAQRSIDFTDLLVTSTVLSAVLGLALQEVLGNVFAGLALHAEAPFKTGDWLRIREHEGQVVQMGWRTLTLRTRQNHHILITNDSVARNDVLNFARPSRLQAIDFHIGVSYADPPAQVKAVLLAAAQDSPGVRKVPSPVAYTESYDDFSIGYRLRFWITDYGRLPEIRDGVVTRIWYQLKRHGMTIPFPIRDVRMRQEEPPDRDAEVGAASAILASHALMGALDPDALASVADKSEIVVYAPGEAVVSQGEPGDSMFIVCAGRLRVEAVPEEGGDAVFIVDRGPGDYFGEMSLLTGEPRSATVVAETESELLRVDKAAVAEAVQADPRVAEQLSNALATRAAESEARLTEITERRRAESAEDVGVQLLRRMREFFGLQPDD